MSLSKKLSAEFFGTFWLVFGGCGSAVLAAAFPAVGIGLLGVSLAFGLTVLTMAYAVGHISGGHFNPAVTVGLFTARRIPASDVLPYIVAQVIGAIVAAAVLYLIASGKVGFDASAGFASNGFGEHSPGKYSLIASAVMEVVMTFFFLLIILGSTDPRVYPARSTGPALFVGGWALSQLWLFWLAPILGAVLAGFAHRLLLHNPDATPDLARTATP